MSINSFSILVGDKIRIAYSAVDSLLDITPKLWSEAEVRISYESPTQMPTLRLEYTKEERGLWLMAGSPRVAAVFLHCSQNEAEKLAKKLGLTLCDMDN